MKSMQPLCALVALALPTVSTAQWNPVAPTGAPSARIAAQLVFELPQNRMLLFGGNATNETWSLANGAWVQLSPATSPSARSRSTLVGDPIGGQVLLYGGLGGGQFGLDDTWTWTGTDWQQVFPSASPGGRFLHAAAYDGARQVFVLFGGRNNSYLSTEALADTLEFANGTWSLVSPSSSPPGRVDAAMAFLYSAGVTVLFGGVDGASTALGDTWVYDGTTWTQVVVSGSRPAARSGARMVSVPSRGVVMLFGGRDPSTQAVFDDTWEFDGNAWRQIAGPFGGVQPARADFAMAHDLVRDRIVLFGGEPAAGGMRNDTWEFGADFRTFGTACVGSAGAPQLALGALPRIGATASVQLVNLLPSAPIAGMVVGFDRTHGSLGPLPASLTPFGLTGCSAFVSLDILLPLPASGGSATFDLVIPGAPGFFGNVYYLQGLSLDPASNPAGLVTSNAASLVIGF